MLQAQVVDLEACSTPFRESACSGLDSHGREALQASASCLAAQTEQASSATAAPATSTSLAMS